MFNPCEVEAVGVITLSNTDKVLKALKQTFDPAIEDNSTMRQEFIESYPDFSELAELPYEKIAAFHTLVMMQMSSLGVSTVLAWTEPMYTGRGHKPFESFDFEAYRDCIAHPEKILGGGNQ